MAPRSKSAIPQNEVQKIIDSRLAAILEKELQAGATSHEGGRSPLKRGKSDSNNIK